MQITLLTLLIVMSFFFFGWAYGIIACIFALLCVVAVTARAVMTEKGRKK